MGNLSDLGFDANNHEPVSFDLLPPGDYEVCVVDSESKDTKTHGTMFMSVNGDMISYEGFGRGLSVTLEVLDGPFKGRKVFDWINLGVRSEKAAAIGAGTLSSLCRAVDVLNPDDSSDLHNIPFIAKIGIEAATEGYSEKNKVKAYKAKTVKVSTKPIQDRKMPRPKPVADGVEQSDDIPF